ncbi:DUF1559 domain-containing protein [uncultured Gimesia sp.]|uniref:DUF1559 domain-containing protein n=1 Tax=uncultured Gimesia sp. TaxID=1678688 RepID=UPI0030DDB4D9|tara:strand:- start:71454 stop:72410 length:957 start_codon:yes stop_codon:yes gene_type:complete
MLLKRRNYLTRSGFVLLELLAVLMIIMILIALLLPAVQQAREAARCTSCKNNLAQIGVALQNYQMAHLVLPSGTVNSKGPILNQPIGYHVGWAIQILPLLDEKVAFHSYDFKFGAYNPANLQTANYILRCFQCPSSSRGGFNYVGCHNDSETPIDVDNNGILFLNSSIREKDLKDGRAYTFFVGEAIDGGFLGWTSGTSSTLRNMGNKINFVGPNQGAFAQANRYGNYGEYRFEAQADDMFDDLDSQPEVSNTEGKKPTLTPEEQKLLLQVGGFSSAHTGGAHFCLGDGAVRFISENADLQILRNLANRHDGNLIGEY